MNLPNCYYCGKFVNPQHLSEVGSYHYPHSFDSPGDPYFYHHECCAKNLKRKAEYLLPLYREQQEFIENLKREGYEFEIDGDTIKYRSKQTITYYSGTFQIDIK